MGSEAPIRLFTKSDNEAITRPRRTRSQVSGTFPLSGKRPYYTGSGRLRRSAPSYAKSVGQVLAWRSSGSRDARVRAGAGAGWSKIASRTETAGEKRRLRAVWYFRHDGINLLEVTTSAGSVTKLTHGFVVIPGIGSVVEVIKDGVKGAVEDMRYFPQIGLEKSGLFS
jgi:hypothetical protein